MQQLQQLQQNLKMLCIFLKKLTLSIPRLNAHELSSNVKSSPIHENKSTFIVAM